MHSKIRGNSHSTIRGNSHNPTHGNSHNTIRGNSHNTTRGNSHIRIRGNSHNREKCQRKPTCSNFATSLSVSTSRSLFSLSLSALSFASRYEDVLLYRRKSYWSRGTFPEYAWVLNFFFFFKFHTVPSFFFFFFLVKIKEGERSAFCSRNWRRKNHNQGTDSSTITTFSQSNVCSHFFCFFSRNQGSKNAILFRRNSTAT